VLQEAVAISERYLERGQSVVSQRGRIQPDRRPGESRIRFRRRDRLRRPAGS
jgi:hypothetical protein